MFPLSIMPMTIGHTKFKQSIVTYNPNLLLLFLSTPSPLMPTIHKLRKLKRHIIHLNKNYTTWFNFLPSSYLATKRINFQNLTLNHKIKQNFSTSSAHISITLVKSQAAKRRTQKTEVAEFTINVSIYTYMYIWVPVNQLKLQHHLW